MSKAVLVMDRMPEECRLCRLIDYDYDQLSASCYFLRKDVSKNIYADKPIRPPKKCPLQEAPPVVKNDEYPPEDERTIASVAEIAFKRGWNACVKSFIDDPDILEEDDDE